MFTCKISSKCRVNVAHLFVAFCCLFHPHTHINLGHGARGATVPLAWGVRGGTLPSRDFSSSSLCSSMCPCGTYPNPNVTLTLPSPAQGCTTRSTCSTIYFFFRHRSNALASFAESECGRWVRVRVTVRVMCRLRIAEADCKRRHYHSVQPAAPLLAPVATFLPVPMHLRTTIHMCT